MLQLMENAQQLMLREGRESRKGWIAIADSQNVYPQISNIKTMLEDLAYLLHGHKDKDFLQQIFALRKNCRVLRS